MALTFPFPVHPARHAAALGERPRWVARFFILAGLYVALGIVGSTPRAEVTAGRLPPSATEEEREAAAEIVAGRLAIDSLFLPVQLFAGWSLFALVLYFTGGIWSRRGSSRYVHFLAAEVYSEGALFLGSLAALLTAFTGDAAGGASPLWIPGGLDALFPEAGFTLRYVLNSVNVFSALSVFLLSVMTSVLNGISRWKAFLSVLLAWGIRIFVGAGILHALLRDFNFGE